MESTFQGSPDRYNGVTVDSKEETCDVELFAIRLAESLQKWKNGNKRCIWFKIRIQHAAWVPLLAKDGFNFHHSREDFVMMYKWLPESCNANLPPACHTSLGVGGIVLNNNNQILVVTEKHTEIDHWKLPGGYVERAWRVDMMSLPCPLQGKDLKHFTLLKTSSNKYLLVTGEDIKDAAVREIKEETGIDAEFESLVTFRHMHMAMFGNSDIYFVVLLRANSDTIHKSEIEIAACKWMDVEEFLNHPNVLEFNRFIVRQALDINNRNLKVDLSKITFTYGNFSREITCLALKDKLPKDL